MIFRKIAAVLAMSLSMTSVAQDSSDQDEEKFVRLTQQLEADPLRDTDKSMRSWLLQWATDSPDITVLVCDVMEFVTVKETPNPGIYTTQMMFGNAAYQISNPEKRNDLLATQLAGVRSALKAYESITAKDPEAKISHFEELLKKDKEGTLSAYLAPVVEKECSESGGG